MEQTLFTNQTLYDRRIYMATQRGYYYKKQWKSRLFALIWGALCFYIAYLKGQTKGFPDFFFCFLGFLMIYFCFWGYWYPARAVYKQRQEALQEPRQFVFTETGFTVTASQLRQQVDYGQVSFLLETRAALGLVSQGQLFMLDKGGFQGVTPAEFREFIAQRCPLQKKLSFKKPE